MVALAVWGDLESLSPAIVVEGLIDLARGRAGEGDDEMGQERASQRGGRWVRWKKVKMSS